jgi:hypothetical protein
MTHEQRVEASRCEMFRVRLAGESMKCVIADSRAEAIRLVILDWRAHHPGGWPPEVDEVWRAR